MFTRTRHWWYEWQRKRRLSKYYSVRGKTADKPHPLTIASWFLSPMLAVVSVFFAYQALKTSHQSMEVGQRAYLSFSTTVTRAPEPFMVANMKTVRFEVRGVIKNLGNTPAYVTSVKTIMKVEGEEKSGEMRGILLTPTVPPKELANTLALSAVPDSAIGNEVKRIFFKTWVFWNDVFDKEHIETSCTGITLSDNSTPPCFDNVKFPNPSK